MNLNENNIKNRLDKMLKKHSNIKIETEIRPKLETKVIDKNYIFEENSIPKTELKHDYEKIKTIKKMNENELQENKTEENKFKNEIIRRIRIHLKNEIVNINTDTFKFHKKPVDFNDEEISQQINELLKHSKLSKENWGLYETKNFDINEIKNSDQKKKINVKKSKNYSIYFNLFNIILQKEIDIISNHENIKDNKLFWDILNIFFDFIKITLQELVKEFEHFKVDFRYIFDLNNIYSINENKFLTDMLLNLRDFRKNYKVNKEELKLKEENKNIINNNIINKNNFLKNINIKDSLKKVHKNTMNFIDNTLTKKLNYLYELNKEIQQTLKRINKYESKVENILKQVWTIGYEPINNILDEDSLQTFNKFLNFN